LDGPSFRLSALPSVARQFRLLEYVHIGDEGSNDISSFIMHLTDPRTLDVPSLNLHCFQHITTFPNLTSLTIWRLFERAFPCSSETMFPALRELKLTTSDLDFAMNFMAVFKNSSLVLLSITALQNSTAMNVITLFNQIYSACVPSRLKSLCLYLRDDGEVVLSNQAMYAISFDIARSLLGYRNLRHLALLSPLGFELDDRLVSDMARAWPQIEALYVGGDLSHHLESFSYPTLRSLPSLSVNCPHLRTLWLAVDATAVPTAYDSDIIRKKPAAYEAIHSSGSDCSRVA
ncbi:hypothetical protein R3P38DRAFT_2553024, partial [Favolaschia claudopus]